MNQLKSKADFYHSWEEHKGQKFLVIIDENHGNKSVTNDIENVVSDCFTGTDKKMEDHVIIYRDSDGSWDGWDHKSQNFIPLQGRGWQQAAEIYLTRINSMA
jgi:hypothetical protein